MLQHLDSDAGIVQGSGSRRLDQHVGVADELTSIRCIVFACDIEDHAAFSDVEVLEQPSAIRVGFAVGKGTPSSQRITCWCFNFSDLGAEVDEQFAAVRTRDLLGDLDHAKPVEGPCHVRHSPPQAGGTPTIPATPASSSSARVMRAVPWPSAPCTDEFR